MTHLNTIHLFLSSEPMIKCWILSGITVPIAVLGAEMDHISPPELLNQYGEILAAKCEVYVY